MFKRKNYFQAKKPAASFATALAFALALLLAFPKNAAAQEDINFWSDYPNEELADALVSRMSDEELYAQILMFGWAGAEPSDLLNEWVLSRGLGSVKVFGWNTDNTTLVARSVKALQQKAQRRRLQIPLFVATDQEGGWIRHVKGNTSITYLNLAALSVDPTDTVSSMPNLQRLNLSGTPVSSLRGLESRLCNVVFGCGRGDSGRQ